MFSMAWLDTLENLAQLISNLRELVVDLLAEVFMFLFKSANLLFQTIDPLGVDFLGDSTLVW